MRLDITILSNCKLLFILNRMLINNSFFVETSINKASRCDNLLLDRFIYFLPFDFEKGIDVYFYKYEYIYIKYI